MNSDARPAVFDALRRAGGPIKVAEIARRAGRSHAAVQQILYALQDDDVVRCLPRKPAYLWQVTGRPLPAQLCAVGGGWRSAAVSRYDHRALAAALGDAASVAVRMRGLPATAHFCR